MADRIDEWHAAGVIDAATAARIRAFEAARPPAPPLMERPALRLALAGLGLFAVALGILLLVAANWDAIPDALKLAVHLALTAAAAWAVWRWRPNAGEEAGWRGEASLFILGALVLAGIALQAQVYQLTGETWEALLGWAALMTPALLLLGRGRVAALGWALLVAAGLAALAIDLNARGVLLPAQGLWIAWPPLLVALAAWGALAPEVRAALRDVGLAGLLLGGSLVHLLWAQTVTAGQAADMAARLLPAAAATALALWMTRRDAAVPPALRGPLLLGPALAVLLANCAPHPDVWWARLIGVFIYFAMWAWIARAAALAGWNRLFGLAVAALAVRLFIIYIELFGTLASTGGGLVAGGLLLLALAWGWQRVTARFARRAA